MLPAARLSPCHQALPWCPAGRTGEGHGQDQGRLQAPSKPGTCQYCPLWAHGWAETLAVGWRISHPGTPDSCCSSYHWAPSPNWSTPNTKGAPLLFPQASYRGHSPQTALQPHIQALEPLPQSPHPLSHPIVATADNPQKSPSILCFCPHRSSPGPPSLQDPLPHPV